MSWLASSALFLSAFLMFLVEPMIARMVVPLLGGAPMVWITCVVFFQIAVFAGYAAAHAFASLRAGALAAAYIVLLVAGAAALPIALPAGGPPAGSPVAWLLPTLLRSIGLPFVALSMSASVLQRVFATTSHSSARDPYFLYIASNVGSLAGLLAYPLVIEPVLGLQAQSRAWTFGYALLGLLAIAFVVLARPTARAQAHGSDAMPPPALSELPALPALEDRPTAISARRRVRWILLALVPSSLMLAVTAYVLMDIVSAPLLWIGPLLVYLLTFALAFSSRGAGLRRLSNSELPLLVVAMAVFMSLQVMWGLWLFVALHLLLLAAAGLLCHGALAADRPPPSRLTEFYFWIAFGGMLGGLLASLVAPLLFTRVVEYPIALTCACLFRTPPKNRPIAPGVTRDDVLFPAAIVVTAVSLTVVVQRLNGRPELALYIPAFLCFSQKARPMRFALCIGALLLAPALTPSLSTDVDAKVLHAERTFFGVYRVTADPAGRYHSLFHGTTLHGLQATDPARENEPLTYYDRGGPFGQAYVRLPQVAGASQVAAVGLGVGSLASYAHAGQQWTFYEIDPAVERMARSDAFSHLRRCAERCRVVIGDGRVSLARSTDRFGLIVLDAFSSDAIPVHLITSEAMRLYTDRLTPGGVVAFHISNRYLRLSPVLARIAAAQGLTALEQLDRVPNAAIEDGRRSSDWVLIARHAEDLAPLRGDPRWIVPHAAPSTPLWRDDFSNILSVMSWR